VIGQCKLKPKCLLEQWAAGKNGAFAQTGLKEQYKWTKRRAKINRRIDSLNRSRRQLTRVKRRIRGKPSSELLRADELFALTRISAPLH
jgi:hypothetical protein